MHAGYSRTPIKLTDQVNHMPQPYSTAGVQPHHERGAPHFLMPATPDMLPPLYADAATPACPRARPGPTPQQTMMSVLQVGTCCSEAFTCCSCLSVDRPAAACAAGSMPITRDCPHQLLTDLYWRDCCKHVTRAAGASNWPDM